MLAAPILALALAQEPQAPPPAPAESHETTPAHGSAEAPAPEAGAGHQATGEAAHEGPAGHEATGESEHEGPAAILMHHVLDQPRYLGAASKHLVFFVVAAVAVIAVIRISLRTYGKGQVPTGLGAAVEAVVLFIRDDIAEKNIGHDGRKFTPLLCSFFFFILVAALLGLVPFTATSTGNIAVTLALATVSFLAQQYAGISKFGVVHHFEGIVPPGLPAWLLPIMIPVEILSMFTKPFALMIRLFANMLAGHMVITTLLLLIPLMASITPAAGWMMSPVSIGLSLFIMLLEVLVAFIQAFIFTLLTAIFIGMYAHPAH
jgi:F-type H+-transporting ATPase subunit a